MPRSTQKESLSNLLQDLNSVQKEAVTYGSGPLLIIAGAGTGKTKVITQRIAYLIASKLAKPEEILAVTFTEKAANEMEERVDLLIPYSYSFVEISTFNSFGERVLRNYALELGYSPDFKLLDDVEQAIFFREHLFDFPLDYYRPLSQPTKHIQELLNTIKRLKQEDIRPNEYLGYSQKLSAGASDEGAKERALKHLEMATVYHKYQELLRKEGKIDFEDQVLLVVELWRQHPSILEEFQDRYKYILVDEFQDTNYIQFLLLKLLAAQSKNLTVCGDDDQSIFRFRGASLSNIYNFREVYPDYRKVVLNKNYRSTQSILDSAQKLIKQNNPDRLEFKEKINKALETSRKSKGKSISLLQFDTVSHEVDKVAEMILAEVKQGYKYGDIAVLVRRNADADPFLRALNMKEIPFRFSGSRGLYAQDEVKVLVSFIKSLTDFEDSKSLFYLALSDVYKTDPYDLTKVSNYAHKKNLPLHEVFKTISRRKSSVEISVSSLAKIEKIFEDLLYFVQLASSQNAGRVIYSFLERTGYLKSLVEERSLPAELKIKNIRIFFDKVKNFSELTDDDSIYSFAHHLDILQQVGDNPATAEAELEQDAVSVLTVHKAKGLEFPVVFMVSLIGDRFPGRERKEKIPVPDEILKDKVPRGDDYSQEQKEKIYLQEERRLFYVGMTRAKDLLYLTWARDYGLKRLKKLSPFVLEALDLPRMPDDILQTSAIEEIRRYSKSSPQPKLVQEAKNKGVLTLSYFQVDDYLTCPLKYRYRHIIRIPVLPHHNLIFGRVLHNTIHFYLRKRAEGMKLSKEELLGEYDRRWINEGFLSREHEEARKKAGAKALRLFYRREEGSKRLPQFLEKSFKWQLNDVKFIGRWDRVDYTDKGAVIVDFKATEVKDQKEADKKARDSLQMDLYALSFVKTHDVPLLEIRLHFLGSDIIGYAQKKEKEMEKAVEQIKEAEAGIRAQDYIAKPDWHNCNFCDFRTICPSSYAY
jgi:DNA helicase-2/ATP-dependent DNA helicase PcrA